MFVTLAFGSGNNLRAIWAFFTFPALVRNVLYLIEHEPKKDFNSWSARRKNKRKRTFGFALCTFGLDEERVQKCKEISDVRRASPKVQRNFELYEKRVRKFKEFRARRKANTKVQRNFGLDDERVRKCKKNSESIPIESRSAKEFRNWSQSSPKVRRNSGLDCNRVQKCEGISDTITIESESAMQFGLDKE